MIVIFQYFIIRYDSQTKSAFHVVSQTQTILSSLKRQLLSFSLVQLSIVFLLFLALQIKWLIG